MKDASSGVRSALKAHGQEHVLRWYSELGEAERAALVEQLEKMDWTQVEDFRKLLAAGGWKPEAGRKIEPAEVQTIAPGSAREARAREAGERLLAAGKVAVVTVAGGQGTRLGFSGPKGAFPVTPVRKKTLFQLHAEKIRALGERFGRAIPWYVMTSEANDGATREFFAANGFFGMARADVQFFTQAMAPALDARGKLVMETKGRVFMSPNGHGGTLEALVRSGMIADMERRGVEEIFYFQVDNVLVQVADPVFMGLHHEAGAGMSCKVCMKRDAGEKLGVTVRSGERVEVIEYSDLARELAEARDEQGRLRFGAGSVAIHALAVEFVRSVVEKGAGLPWHVAHKKVPCVDEKGEAVSPTEPNAYKFERFIFDALPMSERVVLMEADRAEEFAPVKQAEGEDSPATAQRALVEQAARRLERAGVKVPREKDGTSRHAIEISPLYAPDGDLRGKAKGMAINGPTYLGPEK